MPFQSNLTDRHQDILRATIRHYIATAEPVGSKTLIEEYDFTVSSATIRNVMVSLEKAGFLYQPHTSAGRIPSDSGYRFYVDQLINFDENVGRKMEQSFHHQLQWESWSCEALLQKAAQILATLSGYIALITMPQTATNQLRHLQLISVNATQIMLIIVTDGYQSQSVLIDQQGYELSEEELQILSNFLNSKLRGRSLSELAIFDWSELDQEFQYYANFLKTLFQELTRRSQVSTSIPIMVRGVSEVLRQPEFSQLEQVKTLLHLLEKEQEQILPLIYDLPDLEKSSKGVKIMIGSENPLEPMRPCTLISSLYRQGNIPVGSVGVIGPTRMLYENTIALVESAAAYLSLALS